MLTIGYAVLGNVYIVFSEENNINNEVGYEEMQDASVYCVIKINKLLDYETRFL